MEVITKLVKAASLLLASRKDEVLKKYPNCKNSIPFFLENCDPGHNQKYLEWCCVMLEANPSGYADIKSEIKTVVELFHKYSINLPKKDINKYTPADFETLYGKLRDIEDARSKKKERYKLPSDCKSEVIYESPRFLVQHVQNKSASSTLGLGTKWCIAMKEQHHWEKYIKENNVFFVILAKNRVPKNFEKVAVQVTRKPDNSYDEIFFWNAENKEQDDIDDLLGSEAGSILSKINEVAKQAPQTLFSKLVYDEATKQEIEEAHKDANKLLPMEKLELQRLMAQSSQTPGYILEDLSHVKDDSIIEYLILNKNLPKKLIRKFFDSEDRDAQYNLAGSPHATPEVIEKLSRSDDLYIRVNIAKNPNTSPKILEEMANRDASNSRRQVLWAVAKNPKTPVNVLMWLHTLEDLYDTSIKKGLAINPATPSKLLRKIIAGCTQSTSEILYEALRNTKLDSKSFALTVNKAFEFNEEFLIIFLFEKTSSKLTLDMWHQVSDYAKDHLRVAIALAQSRFTPTEILEELIHSEEPATVSFAKKNLARRAAHPS